MEHAQSYRIDHHAPVRNGAGLISTFAWYSVGANASVTVHAADVGSSTTEPSTIEEQTLYLEIKVNLSANNLALTTKDGYTFAAVNGHLIDASADYLWGTATFGYTWYTTRTGTGQYSYSGTPTAEQLATIGAHSGTVTGTAGSRTRVAKTAPAGQSQAQFAAVFNNADSDSLKYAGALGTISVSVAAGGAVTFGQSAVYYSISGETTNKTKAEIDRDSFQDDEDEASVIGSLSLAVSLS